MRISASFLGCKNIPKLLSDLNVTDVDYIHVDVIDGKYAKEKTMPFSELSLITNYTRKRLDVHLMVEKPLKLIDDFATLNVEFLTFHINIQDDLEHIFKRCRDYGIKIGLAINPTDDISIVFPYLDKIDLVLVMGVIPGRAGQEMIKTIFSKINALKFEITNRGLSTLISVDGGITLENAKLFTDVDIISSTSAIVNSSNYQEAITKLRGN